MQLIFGKDGYILSAVCACCARTLLDETLMRETLDVLLARAATRKQKQRETEAAGT
jgi:hypothetical protein